MFFYQVGGGGYGAGFLADHLSGLAAQFGATGGVGASRLSNASYNPAASATWISAPASGNRA
jgi:hypothetical protein